jgi:hypothetical protein
MSFPATPTIEDRYGRGPTSLHVGPLSLSTRVPRIARRLGWTVPIATLLVVGSVTVAAGDARGGLRDLEIDAPFQHRFGVLQLSPVVEIDRVGPGELLEGGGRAEPIGRWVPGGATPAMLDLDTRIVRRVPSLWRMRVATPEALQDVNVRYRLTAPDGTQGMLVNENDPTSIVRVRLESMPPVIGESGFEGLIVEGGVTLEMDFRDVRTAGSHSGVLTVTVEQF